MNIQAMMKQAQQLQKQMMNAKKEIDETEYEGKSSFVTVLVTGDKKIKNVSIDIEQIDNDEIEMLQDLIQVAVNDAMSKIDSDIEKKLGKYTNGMPGLF